MKSWRVDRWFWIACAFLVVNACGWWWVKSSSGVQRPEVGGPKTEAPTTPELKSLALTRLEQAALTPERLLTVAFEFDGWVDWKGFAERLTLTENGKPVAWHFVGKNRNHACRVQSDTPVLADRLTVRLAAGVRSGSRDVGALEKTEERLLPVVPEFRFTKINGETPPFGHPVVTARFTQPVDVRDAKTRITCEPAVIFTVTSEEYGHGVSLVGPFEIGQPYTFIFHEGLRSTDGYKLEKESRRTILIRHRKPAVSIAVDGRYLAPEGRLTVPVLTVNTPQVVSSVARVLPQNLVQLAMREAGLYEAWWGDEAHALSKELTACPVVRTNQVSAARNQEQRLMIHLGEYVADSPRGVYLLEVGASGVDLKSRLLCVTDIGLSVRAEDKAMTVWVTSLRAGSAVAGYRVELFGRNNLLLAQGLSDAQGFVHLKVEPREGEPFLLVAQAPNGTDSTFLPLTGRTEVEQAVSAKRGYLGRNACEAFVMSERDLYRHGETAFVQALLRTREGRAPVPFPIVLHVIKPDGRTFKTLPLMPDALGAAVAQVTLPDYLPSGTYALKACLPGKDGAVLGERAVMLEAFVPPQTRLKLFELPATVHAGETLTFKLFAEHLFGKPAGGLAAEAGVTYVEDDFKPEGWKDYRFGDAEKAFPFKQDRCERQTLAEDGTAVYRVAVGTEMRPPAQLNAVVQGTVTETGGRTVSARATVKLHPYPFYVGLKPDAGQMIRVGVPQTMRLAAVNPDGSRHVERTPLKVKLEQISWISNMRKEPSGFYQWSSERVKTTVAENSVETCAEDSVYAFTVQAAGAYVLTFAEPVSQTSSSWAFAAGGDGQEEGTWDRSSPDRVELIFDKPEYVPGETARLQIRSPFAGQAWVSLQQARVIESRVLNLTNNTAEVAWTVSEAFAPNVEVAVSVVRPAVAESVWSAHRASGLVPLRVCPPERRLKVSVTPEAAVWRPRSTLPVRVAVTDSEGRPSCGAVVTVMAVDEGVCMLTDYKTPDPHAYFLETRAGALAFHDTYRQLMPITSERLFGGASHIGGDGGDELLKRLNPVAARRFTPVALWQAKVALDEKGIATVPFELPEFTGELRLMAVAWNTNAAGSSDAPVKVKRKLVVQPDLPRVLAPGDAALMQVTLHNESGFPCTARVSVVTQGPLVSGAGEQQVSLATGTSQTVPLKVTAREQSGTAQVTVKAEGAGERYEEPIELAVRAASAWQVTVEHSVLKPGEMKTYAPLTGVLEDSFSQTFFCAAQPTVNLLGALEYVAEYPYGCLEQTVSSVFPLLALGDLAGRLPTKGSTLAEEAPGRINAAVLRVLSMQRCDGFAMWPEVQESDGPATVYASHFLVEAARAGYPVARETMEEVTRLLANRLDDDSTQSRAYVCEVLALAGKPDHGWQLRLFEQTHELSVENRLHLARALIRSGEIPKARGVLAEVSGVNGLREAAFGLLAWLELDATAPLVVACCQEIEKARREEGHWGSTQDNALALLALGAYARHAPAGPQTFAPVLGWAAQSRSVAATQAYTWVPGAEADRQAVKLTNQGPGLMYVTRRMACVPLVSGIKEIDRGIKIRREWLDVEGRPVDPAALRRGTLVIIRLTLDPLDGKQTSLVIEDLLPACFEIENSELAKAGTLPWVKTDEADWVLHREARDDRLLLFSKTVDGPQCFHYAARVVTPGEFVVPAVMASAMYAPDTLSRHGCGRVTVKE